MRIEGNLATYEFSDLLQWLAQGNKTGILTVTDGEVEYKLGFDHGRVDMSSSSDPSQRLDSYLHGKGLIDDATLARAERLRDATQMMSGQVLVTLGSVNEAQLVEALREKTQEILCELLTWDQGSFEFAGGERPEATMVPISLEVTKLLLESMHRLDEQRGGGEPVRESVEAAKEDAEPVKEKFEPVKEEVAPVKEKFEPVKEIIEPTAAFVVEEQGKTAEPAAASPAREGLALAEVLDPASAAPSAPASPELPVEDLPSGELPPPYVVMTQAPGALRRYAPYGLLVALSLTIGGFYLANKQANAQSMTPAGEPILFTQTQGPPAVVPPLESPAAEPAAFVQPSESPQPRVARPTEELMRQRYEQEIAGLRQELEDARRLALPAVGVSAPAAGIGPNELPEDAIVRATADLTASRRAGPVSPEVGETPTTPVSRQPTLPVPAEPEPPPPTTSSPPTVPEPAAEPAEPTPVPSFDLVKPSLLSRPAPRYPPAAQRHRRGAIVVLRVLVGVDGRVEAVERSGAKAGMGFDRAAEVAALASTWEPGRVAGEPTQMWAELRFEFKP